jgi:hypothetical protein
LKLSDLTSLGRVPIDPRHPTNLAIGALALGTTLAIVAFRYHSGEALMESAAQGIGAGFFVFLTWALGRELDPDHDLSSFVGTGLVLVALWFVGAPSFTLILWLLVVLRIVNRTVGLPAQTLESIAVLGFGAWLAWQGHWWAGLVTAAAFLLDGLLSAPLRYNLAAAGLSFGATLALSVLRGEAVREAGPTMFAVVAASGIALLFLVVIATSREVDAVGDATGERLDARRVQAAQGLALFTALLTVWWSGIPILVSLLPLWAAMLGAGLYRLGILSLRFRQ